MKVRKIPMRKCVGCGELKTKKELIRIVATPEGAMEVDRTGKKNGRGVYICDDPACFEKAFSSHGLERSLKRPVSKDVYETLRQALTDGE